MCLVFVRHFSFSINQQPSLFGSGISYSISESEDSRTSNHGRVVVIGESYPQNHVKKSWHVLDYKTDVCVS